MQLAIEMTAEQHQRLKTIAELSGQSIQDYVLARVLTDTEYSELQALRSLEALLEPRVQEARQGPYVDKSVLQIFEEALQRERCAS